MKPKTQAQAFSEVLRDCPATEEENRRYISNLRRSHAWREPSTGVLMPGTYPGRVWATTT